MAQGGSITIKAILDTSQFTRGVGNIKSSLGSIGAAGTSMGSKVGKGASTAKAGLDSAAAGAGAYDVAMGNLASQGITMAVDALGNLGMKVLDASMSFETSMSKVQALSGASGAEMEQLSAKAQEMGEATQFSASQCADALGYMALAGWDTQQMLDGLPGVLNLAAAGQMDLASASDIVTDYLSAFGMEASQAGQMSDVMAYAQGNANTSTEQLGAAFKNCAANAHAAGMDVETATAAISMMSNQGLKGAEAGTALNAIMRDLTSNMQDGSIAIGETSIAVTDAQGNYRNFCDILSDVESATNGMGDAEKAAALQSTFTADSIKGMNLLLNAGSGELRGFADELYNSSGAAEDMAATMTDNLQGDIDRMKSGFEGLAISVGESTNGALRGFVQFITNQVIPAIGFLVDNADIIAVVLAGVGAAMVALNWGTIVAGITRVIGVFKALGVALMANPFAIVALAIAAAVAAFMYFYKTNETVRNAVNSAWESIKNAAMETWGVIGPYIQQAMDAAAPVVQMAMDAIGQAIGWLAENVLPLAVSAFQNLCGFIQAAAPVVAGIVSAAWGVISSVISFTMENIVPVVQNAFNTISGAISAVMSFLSPYISAAWNVIKNVFSVVLGVVSSLVSAKFNAIKGFITTVMSVVQPIIKSAWDRIKGAFEVVSSIASTVSSNFNSIKESMIQPITAAKDKVKSMLDKIKSFFPLSVGRVLDNIRLPHISVNGGTAPYGIGGKGSLPSFSVNWYAKGGIFNSPSIIGVGEGGREAALPLNRKSYNEIARGISGAGGFDAAIDRLISALPYIIANFAPDTLKLDRREFARLVRSVG